MIVTIDGPAGAGKSTAARLLARRLGFDFLDTGAMYRVVALAVRRAGLAGTDELGLEGLLGRIQLEIAGDRVLLDGEDVATQIRTPEVTALSRFVADSPIVRRHLSRLQRQVAQGRDVVTEGRDQGTLVFPDAACKFFLTASPEERAGRRHRELLARGENVSFEEVLRSQAERDGRDAARAIAPMRPAPDAVVVDSTGLGIEAVVDVLERHVRERLAGDSPAPAAPTP